ncbi:MAG TPA: hypothetical protein VF747_11655 [Blastocatellia bacterium]|jgi:hypothetical protein
MDKEHNKDKPGDDKHTVTLQVQTPRGLWSTTQPEGAAKRPVYPQSAKMQQIIDDAREVFKFVEADSKYTLLEGTTKLEPERTIVSYHLKDNTLLLLSVKGGNA